MSDFIIIGAGIIGLLTARALSQQGAQVTLLDAQALGQEASWAGGGIISPLYPWRYPQAVTALAQHAQTAYPALAKDLLAETGIDIELKQSGLLMLAARDTGAALQWAQQQQVAMQPLTATQTQQHQPGLGIDSEALWMPQIRQVRNTRLLKALIKSLQQNSNVILKPYHRVSTLTPQANTITSVVTPQKTFQADNIIVAAGCWTQSLLKSLNLPLAITPVKGQMLLMQAEKDLLNTMVLHRNHYLIPRANRQILVGSTLEHDAGFDKRPTQKAFNTLYQAAIDMLPALKNQTVIAQWAGLRPGSVNGIPYIGRAQGYKNLYINAGHFRNGLVLAPGAVHSLCAHLNVKKPVIA